MSKQLETLIAEMKAAIEKATPGQWNSDEFCGNTVTAQSPLSLTLSHVHGNNAEDDMKYIALMCPDNARKLIAALESSPVAVKLPAVPEGADQRLAAAVGLLKQAAPHMLADESLKDPDGALCGKRRAVPNYPECLPCPVLLEPGLRLGKGVKTRLLLDALSRRAEYYARIEAMTPEERAEHDDGIAAFKSMLDNAIAAAPKPKLVIGSGISPGVHSSRVTKPE